MEEQDKVGPADKMNQVDVWLDEFEQKIGLPKYTDAVNTETEKYLNLSTEELERLSPEECDIIGLHLDRLAFAIQRAYNREVAHLTWATENLKLYVADKCQQYKGSFIHQELQAIKNDDYAVKLNQMKCFAQQRVDRLSFVGSSLHKRSDKIFNLKTKRVNYAKG